MATKALSPQKKIRRIYISSNKGLLSLRRLTVSIALFFASIALLSGARFASTACSGRIELFPGHARSFSRAPPKGQQAQGFGDPFCRSRRAGKQAPRTHVFVLVLSGRPRSALASGANPCAALLASHRKPQHLCRQEKKSYFGGSSSTWPVRCCSVNSARIDSLIGRAVTEPHCGTSEPHWSHSLCCCACCSLRRSGRWASKTTP